MAELAALQMHQEVQRWGYARQPVQVATGDGHRFVVAGESIFAVPEHHTFHDFLLTHLRNRLDGPWASEEPSGSEDDRHPLLRWFSALQAMKRSPTGQDSPVTTLHQTVAAPSVYDMLRLAYDLYTVRDAGRLEDALVKRLIAKQEFAPARYELAVAACFIRAGFELTLIDPSKGNGRPCEFTAVSTDHSEAYSVEAKCRQRPGVLGFPGVAAKQDALSLDVTRLIRAAFLKDAEHERVVFVDVSLPASLPDTVPDWVSQFKDVVEDLQRRDGPSAFVVATNSPNRYLAQDAAPAPDAIFLTSVRMDMSGLQISRERPHLLRLLKAWIDSDRVPSRW